MDQLTRAIVEGILNGGTYALIALGVVVVYKASGVFNIAFGELMILFAYLTTTVALSFFSIWTALPIVIIVGTVAGLFINRILMKPVIGQPMMIPFMICLLLGIFVNGLIILIWSGLPRVMPDYLPSGRIHLLGISVSGILVWSFVIALVIFGIFVLFFQRSKTGLAMRAVAESTSISQSLGVSVNRIFAMAWIVGCAAAVVCGILVTSQFSVDPTIGQFTILRALPVLLLGGLESIPGALVGAVIIGLTETMAATYVEPYVSEFRDVLPFILMVIILMIRPQGIFGQKRIERI